MHEQRKKKWLCIEFPSLGYREGWDLQSQLVLARREKNIDTDVVLLLEHPPVFTLGRRGGLSNLTVSESFLEKASIPVIQVERGGSITFHGPGQLIAYPIIDLRTAGMAVADYVENLEEIMIRSAADWAVKAERNPRNRGIWVGNNKLGSLGIAIRHGICFHGLAFNVNLSLKPFGWINPCGLQGVGVTSMERELSRELPMNEMRETVKHHFETVFGVEMVVSNISNFQDLQQKVFAALMPQTHNDIQHERRARAGGKKVRGLSA